MAPTKSKAKRQGGSYCSNPNKKNYEGRQNNQASATTVHGQHLRVAKEVASSVQDNVSQKP